MALVDAVTTTPAMQMVARKLALLLDNSDAVQVRTGDERMKWFKYTGGKVWDKEFVNLLNETKYIYAIALLLTSKANNIKLAIEKRTGSTLRKSQPNEQRPLPTLEHLDAGWVTVPAGYVVFLISIAPEDCAETAIQVQASMKDDNYVSVSGWLCGFGFVLFEGVSFQTEPAGFPYASIPLPMSPCRRE